MGVDLLACETDDKLSINWGGWRMLIAVGEEFGWKPKGTSDPYPYEEWGQPGRYFEPTPDRLGYGCSYFSNDGVWVDPDDALLLAAALESALKASDYTDKPVAGESLDPQGNNYSDEIPPWFQRFVDFCRESRG